MKITIDVTDKLFGRDITNGNSVIYGHWIYGECGNDKYIKCSFCRKIIVNNIVTLEGDIAETAFVLCPYCGARLKKEVEE